MYKNFSIGKAPVKPKGGVASSGQRPQEALLRNVFSRAE